MKFSIIKDVIIEIDHINDKALPWHGKTTRLDSKHYKIVINCKSGNKERIRIAVYHELLHTIGWDATLFDKYRHIACHYLAGCLGNVADLSILKLTDSNLLIALLLSVHAEKYLDYLNFVDPRIVERNLTMLTALDEVAGQKDFDTPYIKSGKFAKIDPAERIARSERIMNEARARRLLRSGVKDNPEFLHEFVPHSLKTSESFWKSLSNSVDKALTNENTQKQLVNLFENLL